MSEKEIREILESTEFNLNLTLKNVFKRGYEDRIEENEDYSQSIEKYEIRKMITFELYENYFTPKRHEFELQIVTEIVDAVVKYHSYLLYVGGAAASGVIGNSVYDLIKLLCSHISQQFSSKDKKRAKIFVNLKSDITTIEKYFRNNRTADIDELEGILKIEREKLIPLLKLLGFKKYKRNGKQIWAGPN